MIAALLPCPFCGHDSPEFERMGDRRQSCIVICGNCGARHESGDEGPRNGSSWNSRVSPTEATHTQPASEPVPNIDVDVMLRTIFELCEATTEAPEITPKNEHERGFDRGRRFEAKSIQKTMGQWFQLVFSGALSAEQNTTASGQTALKDENGNV